MDDWQSTPSSNNIIIIIVIILVVVGIIILLIAIWNSGAPNDPSISSQQTDMTGEEDNDDDDAAFDSGSTSTKTNRSSKHNSPASNKLPNSNIKSGVNSKSADQIKPPQPHNGSPANPVIVTPNAPASLSGQIRTQVQQTSTVQPTSVKQVIPAQPTVQSQTVIQTNQPVAVQPVAVQPVVPVQPVISPSIPMNQAVISGQQSAISAISVNPSETVPVISSPDSLSTINNSNGLETLVENSQDSIPAINTSHNSASLKEESIPKISESSMLSAIKSKSENSANGDVFDDISVSMSASSSVNNFTGTAGTESTNISNSSLNLDEMAYQEALASVEDMSIYDDGPRISDAVISNSSKQAELISEINTSQAQKPVMIPRSVISQALNSSKQGEAVAEINTNISQVQKPIMIPRPVISQPSKVNPYIPPMIGSRGNNSVIDETSGFSVDASMTNPASLSSDFSSPTDKSGRTQRKRPASNSVQGMTNLTKNQGKVNTNNPRMGPFPS